MAARWFRKGPSAHESEEKGIRALVAALPDKYTLFSNVALPTGGRGSQTYEHDAVVVGPDAIFTVELKSWGGNVAGNRDRWTLDGGKWVQSPIPLVLAKARALKGLLIAKRPDLSSVWVQGLVFLTAGDAAPRISSDFEEYVCTLRDVGKAITDTSWLDKPRPLLPQQRAAVEHILHDGKPPSAPDRIGEFKLLQRLPSDDRPYEAWLGEAALTGERKVLHAYSLGLDSQEERDRRRARALREATLHTRLRGGPNILQYESYSTTDDPPRIVLQFEDTTPLSPADVWVKEQSPGLTDRIQVAHRIARALAWVHAKGLIHRRLCTEAILVSPTDLSQVRLCAFDLARDTTGMAPTITGSSLNDPAFRCSAPEVLRTSEATERSDLFSLGVSLIELFTGRRLFNRPDDVLREISFPPLYVGDRPVPRDVAELLQRLLDHDPARRPAKAEHVAAVLEDALSRLTSSSSRSVLEPNQVLRDTYELKRPLGRGATSTTWEAVQLQSGQRVVLKLASAAHAHLLRTEAAVLGEVHHPNLVRFYNIEPYDDGNLLVLAYADGVTATDWIVAGDPLDGARLLRIARGLFGALGAMHDKGWLHRDVKPDNLMLSFAEAEPTLLDAGLACRFPTEDDLAVGTVRYKDPLVYAARRWAPENDLFAAFIVLYELLTGTHPFFGNSPEPGQQPNVQREEFPDSFAAPVAERLAALFARAMSPDPAERPRGVVAALDELTAALVEPRATRSASRPSRPAATTLAADVTPETAVASLPLSARAQGALARLGVSKVAQLVGLDATRCRALSNVGAKTFRELRALVQDVAARFPDAAEVPAPPPDRFYPALVDDRRPLKELGRILTEGVHRALAERGVFTIGDLAALPPAAVAQLPSFGPQKQAKVLKALQKLAGGDDSEPATLDELDANLRAELTAAYAPLAAALGLADGVARSLTEVADARDVSRQAVQQAVDLELLRRDASEASILIRILDDLLPRASFAPLEEVARALALRLPDRAGGVSPHGYARLGALLLVPDGKASQASTVRWAVRPPMTAATVEVLLGRLGSLRPWPPTPRADAEAALWDGLPAEVEHALARRGADAAQLLDATLRLTDAMSVDALGRLFTPPVPLEAALADLRAMMPGEPRDASQLLEQARQVFGDCIMQPDDIEAALRSAGYERVVEGWMDRDRVVRPKPAEAPKVDEDIPRQRVPSSGVRPQVVDSLVAQTARGGFRVVALPPAAHHRWSRKLNQWLGEVLGPDRVDYVHVDRVLLDGLKHADLWRFVPYLEPKPEVDYRAFHAELSAALVAAAAAARPGRVTILAQPSLLGPMGLMTWLSGFYEEARGGRRGLIVLAVPGGIHEQRVRLNERFNLPYTPDMAAVYLDAADAGTASAMAS